MIQRSWYVDWATGSTALMSWFDSLQGQNARTHWHPSDGTEGHRQGGTVHMALLRTLDRQ
jgi:hypothetical protein